MAGFDRLGIVELADSLGFDRLDTDLSVAAS